MFQNTAGAQPQIELFIRAFSSCFIRREDDVRLAVRLAVELDAFAFSNIRIIAFAEAVQRFLAVDDRPAQAAGLMVGFKGRQVVSMATAELGIPLEEAFLNVEAKVLGFGVVKAFRDFGNRVFVNDTVGKQHFVKGLAGMFGHFGDMLFAPSFFHGEALGEFDNLPNV